MAGRWFYRGDVDPMNGGLWYCLAGYTNGYVSAVRLTPCARKSYRATVEGLILLTDADRMPEALACIGSSVEEWREGTSAQQRHTAAHAALAYGHYDPANMWPRLSSEVMQVGREPGGDVVDRYLPINTNVDRYIRQHWCPAVWRVTPTSLMKANRP